MTLLSSPSTDPAPDGPATARPARRQRLRTQSTRSPLLPLVRAAIALLDEAPGPATNARRIDRALRDALAHHLERFGEQSTPGIPAVRVACAHLTAGDIEDAYLALLTARDLLR